MRKNDIVHSCKKFHRVRIGTESKFLGMSIACTPNDISFYSVRDAVSTYSIAIPTLYIMSGKFRNEDTAYIYNIM